LNLYINLPVLCLACAVPAASLLPAGLRMGDLNAHDRVELDLATRLVNLGREGSDVEPRVARGLVALMRRTRLANPAARSQLAMLELQATGVAGGEVTRLMRAHLRGLHERMMQDDIEQMVSRHNLLHMAYGCGQTADVKQSGVRLLIIQLLLT